MREAGSPSPTRSERMLRRADRPGEASGEVGPFTRTQRGMTEPGIAQGSPREDDAFPYALAADRLRLVAERPKAAGNWSRRTIGRICFPKRLSKR